MAKRLDATAQAVNTVRPALQDFYASLDDEQKARFNTMRLNRPSDRDDTESCISQKIAKKPVKFGVLNTRSSDPRAASSSPPAQRDYS